MRPVRVRQDSLHSKGFCRKMNTVIRVIRWLVIHEEVAAGVAVAAAAPVAPPSPTDKSLSWAEAGAVAVAPLTSVDVR